MKFSAKVGNGPTNKYLSFGGNLDHSLDTGIVFRIHHCWEIWKVVNGRSSIMIHRIVALVRLASAEGCTVSVLLVCSDLRTVLYNIDTAKQVAMVWACTAKRRH